MFAWFNAAAAEAFATELATFLVADLQGENLARLDGEAPRRVQRTLDKAVRRVNAFRSREPLNFYKKSRLANAFLWTLKDKGWPPVQANRMTDWLTMRL